MRPAERRATARFARLAAALGVAAVLGGAAALGVAAAPGFAAAQPVPPTLPAAGAAVAAAPTVRVPAHTRTVLRNGVTLIIVPRAEVPLLTFAAVLRGGALADPPGQAGLANLTASLLEKGAGRRDAFAFADTVEGAGGSFSAGADAESITVRGQFLARDRDLALELLADALLRPRLDAAEFETLRARQIEFIKSARDSQPSSLIGTYGRALLFGDHPYGAATFGSPRSLAALTHADVQAFHRAQFGADRLTLVFAGDVEPRALERAVRAAFERMPAAPAALPVLAEPARQQGRRVLLVDAPGAAQTYFWLGNTGVPRRYGARAALDVVNTLYGGRFTSILNTELRVKSGLSYGASSAFDPGLVAGPFAITSFAQTENTRRAVDLALKTLDDLHRGTPEPALLQSARTYVLGQFPLRFETASQWAGALADLEFNGLGLDDIEAYGTALAAVDGSAARAVIAQAFPHPADLAIVLIGDAERIRADAQSYGPVVEIALSADEYLPALPAR
jgi:zinc protease